MANKTLHLTPEQLLARIDAGRPYESSKSPWKVNRDTLVLYIEDSGDLSYYEVDLETIRNSSSALDWIIQVARKPWCDDAVIGALVRDLDRIFDFQATMCSGAMSRSR